MPAYIIEHTACFAGRATSYTLESNTCMARDDASEIIVLAPWDDGSWWGDLDGREVGWLEADGVTYYPPPDGINPL